MNRAPFCAAGALRASVRLGWFTVRILASPQDLAGRLSELAGEPVRLNRPAVTCEERKSRTESRRATLRAAAWNLILLEGIGAALGFEPPGLRCVLHWVVGDRAAVTTDARPRLPEFARSLI